MPIPDSERAVVEDEKVRDYLLNLDHLDGGSKAVWFHSLGYVGVKYKSMGHVGRPDRRPGLVLTVWIVEDDDPPRLVTAYPETAR